MRIAQIAPLYESVPPAYYGGTERVVSYLTEELVRVGHEVTLFASGDSVTQARLISPCSKALRLDSGCADRLAYHILLLERVVQHATEFDILHSHIDYLPFPISRRLSLPVVTTLHGRLDLQDLVPVYREFSEMPVISISHAQREPLPWLNWKGTVYHGLPPNLLRLENRAGQYLAFLGRISPEKGVHEAIEIAKKSELPLKMAAKVDKQDQQYFDEVIQPLLRENPWVDFIGEISERGKQEFLGNAIALLFPIQWCEPFGLVQIEAMACGTPVVAYRRGSVSEVIDEGITGHVVHDVPSAVRAVREISRLSRPQCRKVFDARFVAARMAKDYLNIYDHLIDEMAQGGHLSGKAREKSRGYHTGKRPVLRPSELVAS